MGIFGHFFNSLNTQYQPSKMLGTGKKRKVYDLNPKGVGYGT